MIYDGWFTVESGRTGDHRTFEIRTQADDASFAPGRRVVSLLSGANRDDRYSWTGFAFIRAEGDREFFEPWKRYHGKRPWVDYADILNHFFATGCALRDYEEMGFRMLSELKCRRCFRALTHPESIETGYGPECARKVGAA